jgi:hypothetical protein
MWFDPQSCLRCRSRYLSPKVRLTTAKSGGLLLAYDGRRPNCWGTRRGALRERGEAVGAAASKTLKGVSPQGEQDKSKVNISGEC